MKKYWALLLTAVMICGHAMSGDTAFPVQLFCPQPELLYRQTGEFPFAYFWRKDFIDIRRFEKILMKPVIDKFGFSEKERNSPPLQNELKQLSDMFIQEFGKAVEAEGKRVELKLTDEVDDKTMVMEVALVAVIPPDGFRRLMSYQAVRPSGRDGLIFGMLCRNLVVIEAVVRSGEDGELVAQLASLCGEAGDAAKLDPKAWPEAVRKLLADWNLKFVSTIKAELNRSKDGSYLSISGKIQPPADKEKK